jgi:hypothetical protein
LKHNDGYARLPLDDDRVLMFMLAVTGLARDNLFSGIVAWTTSGEPLRVVGA